MSEPFFKYQIVDDMGLIYSFASPDEAWNVWYKLKNNKYTIQPEIFGDVKLIKVLDIERKK